MQVHTVSQTTEQSGQGGTLRAVANRRPRVQTGGSKPHPAVCAVLKHTAMPTRSHRALWTPLHRRAEGRICMVLSIKLSLKPDISEEKQQIHSCLVKASFILEVYLGLATSCLTLSWDFRESPGCEEDKVSIPQG